MNIIIPGELRGEGGVGDAFKGLGGAISKAGAVAKQAADNIQSQYDFNDYAELNQARAVEKEKATSDFWLKEDGSTHDADGTPRDPMANYQALIKSIDDKYREKAGKINSRVADLLDKRGQIENYQYFTHGQRIQSQKLFDRTIKNTQNETDIAIQNVIRSGGDFRHLENQEVLIKSNQQYLDGEGANLGLNAAELSKTEMARGYEASIRGILADPVYSPAFVKTLEAVPELKQKLFARIPVEKWDDIEKLLATAGETERDRIGIDIGTEVFKTDNTGSLENMTDQVRARKLDVKTEKKAIEQIKELYIEREKDKDAKKNDVIDKYTTKLANTALKRNGLNMPSDLTPKEWEELTIVAPDYAAKLQDSMRRELDFQARQNRAESRAVAQDRRLQQADNESTILISDDFATRDLKRDLAGGAISPAQYTRLLKAQSGLDPIKRDSVRSALNKVNSGSSLAKALNVKDKNVEAQWKLKYGDLVKAWAYNHANDPNFDQNMTDFVDKQILSELVTSYFAGDDADRLEKYNKARREAGNLPVKGKQQKQYSQTDLEYTAKKHGITIDEVKKRLGVK